jgi:hypothetical protein
VDAHQVAAGEAWVDATASNPIDSFLAGLTPAIRPVAERRAL